MRRVIGLAGLMAMFVSSMATGGEQPPVIDTTFIRDYALTRGFMLGRPGLARATPDGKAVLFLRSPPRSPAMHLFEFDVATKQTRELLTPADILKGAEETLSPEEKARRERMRVTARGFTTFQLSEDGSLLLVQLSGKLYVVNRADKKVRELPTGKGTLVDPKFSPDGKNVGYVLDYDVYVMDLESLKERRITTGGTEEVAHGLAEFVAQEEMSRFSGWWWSPDSQWIAYEDADARDVEVWRAADPMKPGTEAHPQRYARPGKNNVKVRLGITNAGGAGEPRSAGEPSAVSRRVEPSTIWVQWNREKYPYLATVKWDKGGPLTIVVQTRSQREMAVLAVVPASGSTRELLVEKDDAWLNLDQNVPRWLEDGNGFLWTGDRDGGPQLELRDKEGKLVRRLVGHEQGFIDLLSVDEKARQVFFTASVDPTQAHLWRVPLDGGQAQQLSEAPGMHSASFPKGHLLQIRRFSGPKSLPQSMVHGADGAKLGVLPSVAEEPTFLPNLEFVTVSIPVNKSTVSRVTGVGPADLKGQDEERFHASIIRPRSLDPQRKYPVILYVYGGPSSQVVTQSVGRNLLLQWLADQGFIVVSSDNRGTPRRTRDWERAIVGNFGRIPLDDQVAVLQALGKKFPEMDLNRVGVTGWSFGGYMAALAVLKRPDVFKAAVAGAPVTDWEDYDTHYTERYLGLPEENRQGYKDSNLLTYAADLKRPLLLIHGTSDDNVFFLHTLKLSDALFRAGKDHEVLPLSGLTHMVPEPVVRQRLEERIVRFFQKNL
jgi:dipeptidyl-peptidase-4